MGYYMNCVHRLPNAFITYVVTKKVLYYAVQLKERKKIKRVMTEKIECVLHIENVVGRDSSGAIIINIAHRVCLTGVLTY
jgi:hypothetical protein